MMADGGIKVASLSYRHCLMFSKVFTLSSLGNGSFWLMIQKYLMRIYWCVIFEW